MLNKEIVDTDTTNVDAPVVENNTLDQPERRRSASKNLITLKAKTTTKKVIRSVRVINKTLGSRTASVWQRLLGFNSSKLFVGMVVIPWLLSAGYLLLFASDRYISHTQFLIKNNNGGMEAGSTLGLLGGMSLGSNVEDEVITQEYILSQDMLDALDKEFDLKQHYLSKEADWLSRMSTYASREEFHAYYLEHIALNFDETKGIIELETQGLTPVFAHQLAKGVLKYSEGFINDINKKLASDLLAFVQQQVDRSEQRLKDKKNELVAFQNRYGMFSPKEQGTSVAGIMLELESELVRAQAELRQLNSYLSPNSAKVIGLKQKIAALQTQINIENQRLVGEGEEKLNDINALYQALLLEVEFATQAYQAALASLEKAQVEASRKLKYLVVVSQPTMAEDATYPRTLYTLTTLFIVLVMIFGLFKMTLTTIKEHQD